jgi:hypothetical protein
MTSTNDIHVVCRPLDEAQQIQACSPDHDDARPFSLLLEKLAHGREKHVKTLRTNYSLLVSDYLTKAVR